MKLIINVPDEHLERAMGIALEERQDYARRFDRPGWGWHIYREGENFWVRGVKGGISISHSPRPHHKGA